MGWGKGMGEEGAIFFKEQEIKFYYNVTQTLTHQIGQYLMECGIFAHKQ